MGQVGSSYNKQHYHRVYWGSTGEIFTTGYSAKVEATMTTRAGIFLGEYNFYGSSNHVAKEGGSPNCIS